jgi:hypothetical protein
MSIGLKRVENRTWAPPEWLVGEDFALHAGKRWDSASHQSLSLHLAPADPQIPPRNELVFGAVVAVVRLGRVVGVKDAWAQNPLEHDQRRWFFGPYGWVVDNVRTLPAPVPCRGFQGLWGLPLDVEAAVLEQLAGPAVAEAR